MIFSSLNSYIRFINKKEFTKLSFKGNNHQLYIELFLDYILKLIRIRGDKITVFIFSILILYELSWFKLSIMKLKRRC